MHWFFCCQHLIPLVIASLSIWCWKVCLLLLLVFLPPPFLGREWISDFGSASQVEQEKHCVENLSVSTASLGLWFQRQWLWGQCHTQCPETAAVVACSTGPLFCAGKDGSLDSLDCAVCFGLWFFCFASLSFCLFWVWFLHPKFFVNPSIYPVINTFPVLSSIILATKGPHFTSIVLMFELEG